MQETEEMWVWSLGQEDSLEKEMETHSSIFVLGFFNGLEPGGLELMIRKGKRELEGGREREEERKTRKPKLWWSKGILLAEMQAYISLVRWLLSYYTGWNFINSHNMDSLIHTRLLMLKRVTVGDSYMSHPMTSVLGVACHSTGFWQKLIRNRGLMRNSM